MSYITSTVFDTYNLCHIWYVPAPWQWFRGFTLCISQDRLWCSIHAGRFLSQILTSAQGLHVPFLDTLHMVRMQLMPHILSSALPVAQTRSLRGFTLMAFFSPQIWHFSQQNPLFRQTPPLFRQTSSLFRQTPSLFCQIFPNMEGGEKEGGAGEKTPCVAKRAVSVAKKKYNISHCETARTDCRAHLIFNACWKVSQFCSRFACSFPRYTTYGTYAAYVTHDMCRCASLLFFAYDTYMTCIIFDTHCTYCHYTHCTC